MEAGDFPLKSVTETYINEVDELVHNSCGDIDSYNRLHRQNAGSVNEVHHILEKRFLDQSIHDGAGQMQSILLEDAQHRIFTNAWRQQIAYEESGGASVDRIIQAAAEEYPDYPDLIQIVLFELEVAP